MAYCSGAIDRLLGCDLCMDSRSATLGTAASIVFPRPLSTNDPFVGSLVRWCVLGLCSVVDRVMGHCRRL